MKTIVVLTGAGISAESGVKTFRDAGGLWEGHDVMEVASPQGFARNPKLIFEFYNQRRRQLNEVEPNAAHKALATLQDKYEVQIITQNVDDLHERAGSKQVLHLHGQLRQVRPIDNDNEIIDWTEDLNEGDTNDRGVQLRPHVVWFGEAVPMIEPAVELVGKADILLIIGTSLKVYPAAGLLEYAPFDCPIFLIDPQPMTYQSYKEIRHIQKIASEGMVEFVEWLETED